jgi:hypothetical protein
VEHPVPIDEFEDADPPGVLKLAALIGIVGALLRLRAYTSGRGLWLDEAMLSYNIVSRSFSGLLDRLAYEQYAPVGWLWIVKGVTLLLGEGELALRSVSLVAGLTTLPLAWIVARRFLPASGALCAFSLIALNSRLIYYSGEVKQYASDVVVALVALLVLSGPLLRPADAPPSRRRLALALAFGIGAQLMSHAAILVLAGLGASIFLLEWRRGQRRSALHWGLVGAGWVSAFVALYLAFYHRGTASRALQGYWRDTFAPLPISEQTLVWYGDFAQRLGEKLLGTSPPLLGIAGVLLGAIWFARSARRPLLALASMFPFLWLASLLRGYPLGERLLLFCLPMLLILAAGSLSWVGFEGQSPRRRALWMVAAISLLWKPATSAVAEAKNPVHWGDPKVVLQQLARRVQPGDVVVALGSAQGPLEYYATRFEALAQIRAVRAPRPFDIDAIAARFVGRPRVWLLQAPLSFDPKPGVLIRAMAARGTMLDRLDRSSHSIALFDLRTPRTVSQAGVDPTGRRPEPAVEPRPPRAPNRK